VAEQLDKEYARTKNLQHYIDYADIRGRFSAVTASVGKQRELRQPRSVAERLLTDMLIAVRIKRERRTIALIKETTPFRSEESVRNF